MKSKKNILIVDDHVVLAELFKEAFKTNNVFTVGGYAETGAKALAYLAAHPCDFVLMDINMPGMNGIETTRQLKKLYPNLRVIALSGTDSKATIIQTLKAGAQGYLLKTDSFEVILNTLVRLIKSDEIVISPSLGETYIGQILFDVLQANQSEIPILSDKEKVVLQLITSGLSSKEVAGEMDISTRTVEKHRSTIMKKLQINDLPTLTKYAISNGIISLD